MACGAEKKEIDLQDEAFSQLIQFFQISGYICWNFYCFNYFFYNFFRSRRFCGHLQKCHRQQILIVADTIFLLKRIYARLNFMFCLTNHRFFLWLNGQRVIASCDFYFDRYLTHLNCSIKQYTHRFLSPNLGFSAEF